MTNKKQTADEIAALKREVEELKAKVSPPKSEPFVPEPYQRYDPTANFSLPPSALRDMIAAEPRGFMQGVVHDNRAPTGRPGMIPQQPTSPRSSAGDGTGRAREIPLGPSMHQRYVDAQLDAQDAKDRRERIQQAASADAARKFAEQSEKLQRLIEQNQKLMAKIK